MSSDSAWAFGLFGFIAFCFAVHYIKRYLFFSNPRDHHVRIWSTKERRYDYPYSCQCPTCKKYATEVKYRQWHVEVTCIAGRRGVPYKTDQENVDHRYLNPFRPGRNGDFLDALTVAKELTSQKIYSTGEWTDVWMKDLRKTDGKS